MAFPISVLVSYCVDVIVILSLYCRENCCKCCKKDSYCSCLSIKSESDHIELNTVEHTQPTEDPAEAKNTGMTEQAQPTEDTLIIPAKTKDTGTFSITAFCIACSWGWMLAILPMLIVSAFYAVPLPTLKVTDYIQTIAQTVIVVIGLLLSYKVININESDLSRFLRGIRKSSSKDYDDDLEAAGNILMDAITKRDQVPTAEIHQHV